MTGLVPLDKAEGELSRRAMSAAARLFDERHAGHAGTLDPLATGVLPSCLAGRVSCCHICLRKSGIRPAYSLVSAPTRRM